MVHYKDRYKKESFCRPCNHWTPTPTHIPIDFHIASTNEGNNEHYYDITGKQVDVLLLIPIKQIAMCTRDEKGTFLKMIDEIVSPVNCELCGRQCSGGPYSKTPAKNHYEPSWRGPKRGRPKGPDKNKEEIDYHVDRIKQTKNKFFEETLDDVQAHLRSKVKRRIDKDNEGKESNIDN